MCGGAAVGGKPPGRDGADGNVAEVVVAAAEHECRDSGAAGRLLDAKLSSRAESRRQGVFWQDFQDFQNLYFHFCH